MIRDENGDIQRKLMRDTAATLADAAFINSHDPLAAHVTASLPHNVNNVVLDDLVRIRALARSAPDSHFRDHVLALTANVENLSEREVIDDMAPRLDPNAPAPEAPKAEAKEHELMSWRIESFRDLGFTTREAKALARAKSVSVIKTRDGKEKRYETPLAFSKVKKMLEQGCSPRMAVTILT